MDFDPLPQQRLAIETPLGPTLVVAGPGAGKTFCLIRRVHRLIAFLNFDPARICAVTFTNKAAEEIGVRLKRTLGERAERSEEHTSELQSQSNLVCRLLLEKKKKKKKKIATKKDE